MAAALRAAVAARSERTNVTADRVLLEMARIAFSDIGRVARWGKNGLELKPSDRIDPEDRAMIEERFANVLNRQQEEQEQEAEQERAFERRWQEFGESFGYSSTLLIEGSANEAE